MERTVLNKCIGIIISFIFMGPVYSADVFKPFILETAGSPVCDLVLSHYSDLFKSKGHDISSLAGPFVQNVRLETREVEGIRGEVTIGNINIDGKNKVIVYHSWSFNWINDSHTGYIIDSEQISTLEEQLKTGKDLGIFPFYPLNSNRYNSSVWLKNIPFEYKGKWYLLFEYDNFYRENSVRTVHEISSSGVAKEVCKLKIFKNFSTEKSGHEMPFLSSYRDALENIMLSLGHCGSSRPEIQAKRDGRYFSATALIRPWAIDTQWKSGRAAAKRESFQKKHFNDWKYQDIWSFRENMTLENSRLDAIIELKNYYMNNYSYTENDAEELAQGVINSMPGKYYSLGVYYDENKDFSPFQEMVEGTYKNWSSLKKHLKFKWDRMPLAPLSLLVDTPTLIQNLPRSIEASSVKSFYEKDLLMYAAHMNNYDAVKFLVDTGWPLHSVTKPRSKYSCIKLKRTNRSALTYAVENASIELISFLVNSGADTNIKDSLGNDLDFYLNLNPRFYNEEKPLSLNKLLDGYSISEEVRPSFGCDGQLNRIEKAICSSEGLSIYDRELNEIYIKAVKNNKSKSFVRRSQIKWLKARNSECGSFDTDVSVNACVARETRARTRYLEYVSSISEKGID